MNVGPPQLYLDFLLRSKTYLKECPPSTANGEFQLSNKLEDVVIRIYIYCITENFRGSKILLSPANFVLQKHFADLFSPLQ